MLGAWEEAKSLHTVLVDIAKQMGERMASAEKEGIMAAQHIGHAPITLKSVGAC